MHNICSFLADVRTKKTLQATDLKKRCMKLHKGFLSPLWWRVTDVQQNSWNLNLPPRGLRVINEETELLLRPLAKIINEMIKTQMEEMTLRKQQACSKYHFGKLIMFSFASDWRSRRRANIKLLRIFKSMLVRILKICYNLFLCLKQRSSNRPFHSKHFWFDIRWKAQV